MQLLILSHIPNAKWQITPTRQASADSYLIRCSLWKLSRVTEWNNPVHGERYFNHVTEQHGDWFYMYVYEILIFRTMHLHRKISPALLRL